MKKNELTKLFAFLEKYGINFNEYMLAKMLAWAQTKQNADKLLKPILEKVSEKKVRFFY